MHISQPLWLLVTLAGAPLLWWGYRSWDRRQGSLLRSFASARLIRQLTRSVSQRRVWLKRNAMIAAMACVCTALARPQGGYTTQILHRKGLDILVAIDTSKSMLTPDVKPNRLTRAKLAAEDLPGQLHGDGIGLIAFAGDAFLQSPVTTDYDAFRDSVDALDTNIIPRGGTNIASAIRLAQTTFASRPGSDKILILMTDGEDLDAQGVAAARTTARQGLKIFTIGVGTTAGDLIPVPDASGGTQYLRDASGQPVRSRLDVKTLQQLAQVTGGMYEPLGNQGQGLSIIYSQGLASFARHDLAAQSLRIYTEWFQWPLSAGIVFLIAESLLLTRRRRSEVEDERHNPTTRRSATRIAKAAPGAVLAMAFGVTTVPGVAHASVADAERAYLRGNYAQASKEYEASARTRPTEARLQFDAGAAAYKSGDFNTATTAFQSAVKTGEPALQESAYYNLGNTEYRIGQRTQQAQPQTTIERWQAALKSYETGLQMRPADADAKYNHDLVQHRLAQLQQQQKTRQSSQSQNGKGQQQNPSSGGGKQSKNSQGQGNTPSESQPQNTSSNPTTQNGNSARQPAGHDASAAGGDRAQQSGEPPPTTQPPANSPGSSPRSGQPVAANGTSSSTRSDQSATAGGNADPDRLSREEARQLLDSLKGDERWLPPSPLAANAARDASPPLQDW